MRRNGVRSCWGGLLGVCMTAQGLITGAPPAWAAPAPVTVTEVGRTVAVTVPAGVTSFERRSRCERRPGQMPDQRGPPWRDRQCVRRIGRRRRRRRHRQWGDRRCGTQRRGALRRARRPRRCDRPPVQQRPPGRWRGWTSRCKSRVQARWKRRRRWSRLRHQGRRKDRRRSVRPQQGDRCRWRWVRVHNHRAHPAPRHGLRASLRRVWRVWRVHDTQGSARRRTRRISGLQRRLLRSTAVQRSEHHPIGGQARKWRRPGHPHRARLCRCPANGRLRCGRGRRPDRCRQV